MSEENSSSSNGSQLGNKSGGFSRELYDWSDALVTSLIFVVLLFTFVIRIIGVEGSSMFPTLENNDKVLLTNMFFEPTRGDVVVFTKKGLHFGKDPDEDSPLVKRVIATEGQTVNIVDGNVTVDGETLVEPYINDIIREAARIDLPVTVPEGCVFVLGDNRNFSSDSREPMIGMIDKRFILGHVMLRIWPLNHISVIGQ